MINGYLMGISAVVWKVAGFSCGFFLRDSDCLSKMGQFQFGRNEGEKGQRIFSRNAQQDDQFAANL